MNLTNFLALLDDDQRERFCTLSGTTSKHLRFQLLGGHRAPSLRMLWAMVHASQKMRPEHALTLDEMQLELEALRKRRARKRKAKSSAQGASA